MSKKNTRRALLSSALALLLCVSMLIGSTFAWFTDEVVSSNNIIKSGTLDVELEWSTDMKEWTKVDATTNVFEENALWEPGHTEVVYLKVSNVGTLALKYNLNINIAEETGGTNVDGDEFELSDHIYYGVVDVTEAYADRDAARNDVEEEGAVTLKTAYAPKTDAPTLYPKNNIPADVAGAAAEAILAVVVYMPTEVDNVANYRGDKVPTIHLGINLFATQLEYEEDSFGPDYDADADLVIQEGEIAVYNEETLTGKIVNNGTVTVTDSTMTNAGGFALVNNGTAELTNVVMTAGTASNYSNKTSGADAVTVYNNVTIESAGGGIGVENGGEVVFNSGSVDVSSPSTSGRYLFYVVGEGSTATINDGEFSFSKTLNQKRAYIYVGEGATVYVNGGTFGKASTRKGYTAGFMGDGDIIVTGGTFGFDPTKWVAVGYEAVEDDGVWTVQPIAGDVNEALDAAIAGGKTTISLGSGTYIIPDSAQGKNLSFIGNGNTVIATQDDGSYEGCDYSLDGATVTFKNITINTDSSTYTGYARLNATYDNCTINGTYTLYGNSTFNNCTFNVEGDVYNIWTWGAPEATFNNCTFNSDGKAMLLYGQENTKLTLNNCVFNDNGGLTDLKAAVEIGNDYNKSYELIVNDTEVNGYEINDKGINTNSTLWANKNSMPQDKLNVVVDGVDVY